MTTMLNPTPTDAAPEKPKMRGWIHFVAFILILTLSGFLLSQTDSVSQAIYVTIYLFSIAAMFGTSALLHLKNWGEVGRRRMRRADHSTIFLAIAGSYTAIAGLALTGWHRVAMLSLAWGGAVIGVIVRQVLLDAPKWLIAIPYVVVGWSSLLFLPALVDSLGIWGFMGVLGGGLAYTAGAIFYAAKRPNPIPGVFGYHELFHACTVLGAGLHLAVVWSILA